LETHQHVIADWLQCHLLVHQCFRDEIAMATPSMSAGTTSGAPGTTDAVPVSVSIDTNVVSLQFDLLYATNYLTPGTPVGGDHKETRLLKQHQPRS